MKNLIYKEMKLAIHPAVFLFALLSALLLIPNYPHPVAMFYWIFAIQITSQSALSNKDLQFCSMLPISRKDIVVSKHFSLILIQFVQIAVAVPFALISTLVVSPSGNATSLDANLAFFAVTLLGYSAFNIFFLPTFFETGHKLAKPYLLGVFAYLATVIAFEVVIALVPALKDNLDSLSPQTFVWQITFLIVAIGVYVGVAFWSVARSTKNFEKVSL